MSKFKMHRQKLTPNMFGALLLVIVILSLTAKALAAGVPCDQAEGWDCSAIGCGLYIDPDTEFDCCSVESAQTPCCIRQCYISSCFYIEGGDFDCGAEPGDPGAIGTAVEVYAGTLVPGTTTCEDFYDPVTETNARCVGQGQ